MIGIYILLGVITLLMIAGSVCIAAKTGEKENICNYGYIEEDKNK